ncbi:MAG TPA: cell division protein ZapA [Casimicrobiaceae bacterium]
MSLPRTVTLDVSILGRELKVACKEGEREELTQAVAMLDQRMREIRDGGKVSGAERIAVMAALNIAHDLLRERHAAAAQAAAQAAATPVLSATGAAIDGEAARRRILAMQAAIDQTLGGQEKLF